MKKLCLNHSFTIMIKIINNRLKHKTCILCIMKFIASIIKKILPKPKLTPLGRWGLEQNHIKINNKVDLSNEDHCGPCGQYRLKMTEFKNNKKENNDKLVKDLNIDLSKKV